MRAAPHPPGADCRLQPGIYFRRSTRPGRCYRLLLLSAQPNAGRGQAKESIRRVWARLAALRDELVADLRPDRLMAPPTAPAPSSPELTCLLGFGATLFDRYPALERPEDLQRIQATPPFPSLGWVDRADRQSGEADFALQFIAESELAVSRAVAETWLLIKTERLKLDVVALYAGFNREDRRSWLGFHDGISNIEPDLRRLAIETRMGPSAPENPAWLDGGTYMGFLRLAVDLEVWRDLKPERQEEIVGRRLDDGCPIVGGEAGGPRSIRGCPDHVGLDSVDYRNPPPASVRLTNLARLSHMNRTNPKRHRGVIGARDNRIFRQGYEFLEALPDRRLRIGVNFVSFQRSISALTNILSRDGWLGDANFGGRQSRGPALLTLIGGGYYAVPPVGRPFPGADIF